MRPLPLLWAVKFIALVALAAWGELAIASGRSETSSTLAGESGSTEPVRTWTSARGTTAQARFVGYDEVSGKVHFRRADGRPATAQLRNLANADKEYLAKKLLNSAGPAAPNDLPPPLGDVFLEPLNGRLIHLGAGADRIAKPSIPVVPIRIAARQAEPLPVPFGPPEEAAKVSPRHAFYGCRGTHHLVGLTGTVSYQYHHRWWLTALTAVLPSDPTWLYYNEEQWPYRRWAIRRRATFCCKHAVFVMPPYGMWEFFHYADAVRMAPRP